MPYYGILISVRALLEKLAKTQSIEDFVLKHGNPFYRDEILRDPVRFFGLIIEGCGINDIINVNIIVTDNTFMYVFVGDILAVNEATTQVNEELEKHNLLGFQPDFYTGNPIKTININELSKQKLL